HCWLLYRRIHSHPAAVVSLSSPGRWSDHAHRPSSLLVHVPMTSLAAKSLRHLIIRSVVVVGVVGGGFTLTGCQGVSGTPAAAKASTKTRAEGSDSAQPVNSDSAAVDALYPIWVTARNTVAAANRT